MIPLRQFLSLRGILALAPVISVAEQASATPTPTPSATPQGPTVEWVCSTAEKPWETQPPVALKHSADDLPMNLRVRLTEPAQKILGWGGCFNELGWKALKVLSPERRKEVLESLFDAKSGLGFSICRMPIGASDYADGYYSLNDTDGDYAMEHFSIERDRGCLIPYIREAMAIAPRLQVWASPWTPPAWMKKNKQYGGGGANVLVQEPQTLAAYARYFAKFVTEYHAAGIPISAVAVQNEPFYGPKYPSCRWTPAEMGNFISEYLAPEFRSQKLSTEIWLGTVNNGNPAIFAEVLDSPARKNVDAVGVQWAGKLAIADLERKYPELKKVQTESECGSGTFDWNAAEQTFDLVVHYLSHGVSIYDYWNMVLDESGKSFWGWKQNALIVVNQKDGSVTYTPEYWLFKHLSHFVVPGSVRIPCEGVYQDVLAFARPDGATVIIAVNSRSYNRAFSAKVGESDFRTGLPPRSFNTFLIEAPAAK